MISMAKTNKRLRKATSRHEMEEQADEEDAKGTNTILLTLENNKRYAHTATCSYQLTMASMQPDERRPSNCICSTINDEKRPRRENDKRVIVVIEHNLNEYILCILDEEELRECKLNLVIRPGEQIAFRTIGRTPIQLAGISAKPMTFRS